MQTGSAAGIAYLGGRFAVVRANGTDNHKTFVHEVGHLLRANHEHCSGIDPGINCNNLSGVAHAHTFNSGKCNNKPRKTIMYSSLHSDQIPHFSNPLVPYDRAFTGTPDRENNASIINGYGCTAANLSTLFNDAFKVEIYSDPTACANNYAYLDAHVEGTALGTLTYQWRVSTNGISYGSVISTASGLIYQMPPHIGAKRYFKLTVTTVNGQTLDAFWAITATDPENCDKQRPRSLTSELNDSPVYPNPISQFCSLQLKPSVENEPGYLQIVDINGKEVGALEVFAPDHGLLQIDLGNISSGLYVLRVTTPTRMASYKVIKN